MLRVRGGDPKRRRNDKNAEELGQANVTTVDHVEESTTRVITNGINGMASFVPVSKYFQIRKGTILKASLVFLLVFAYISIKIAIESKSIAGIELGHERAVELNRYLIIPGMLRRGVNWLGQTKTFLHLVSAFGGVQSRKSWAHAYKYYTERKQSVIDNAVTWELHSPLEELGTKVYPGMSFYDIVAARAKIFLKNLKRSGLTDFRIEKDKCDMYSFLYNNGFPHCDVIQQWDNLQDFQAEGMTIRQDQCLTSPYCFVKMCHITMGHLNSAKRLSPTKEWPKIVDWAQHLWGKRPIDWDRTWGPTFDKLTNTIPPRVMIQEGFKGGRDYNGDVDTPLELKVEVVWGYAYLAYVTVGAHACNSNPVILRDGTIASYELASYHVEKPDPCHNFLFTEGHMEVAWHLAEAFAKAANIDSIRVDIFVTQGADPRSAVVNEISLSSGAGYAWHWEFFTDLWVSGYLARQKMKREGKKLPVSPDIVSMEKIDHGKQFYAVKYSKCNKTLISPGQYTKYCEPRHVVDG